MCIGAAEQPLEQLAPLTAIEKIHHEPDTHGSTRVDLARFLLRVSGDSMRDAGVFDNAILFISKAIKPRNNIVEVAVVGSAFTAKKLYRRAGRVKRQAANPTYPDIVPKEGHTVENWGVMATTIKQCTV